MARSTGREKGISLAKGPVGLLGLAMLAYGVIAFLLGGDGFGSSPVDGTVDGETFLGIEGNGWTNLLWAGSGLLLAFGAPLHWGAKSLALIVGLVLGAASVIAIADGSDVFGIFAANGTTMLAFGAVSIALLVLSLLPRVGRKQRRDDHPRHDDRVRVERDRGDLAHGEREPLRYGDSARVNDRSGRFAREPVTEERQVVPPADGDDVDPERRPR